MVILDMGLFEEVSFCNITQEPEVLQRFNNCACPLTSKSAVIKYHQVVNITDSNGNRISTS